MSDDCGEWLTMDELRVEMREAMEKRDELDYQRRVEMQAVLCWHHLYRWPEIRNAAREARAAGDIRLADILVEVADRARPQAERRRELPEFS